MSFLGGVLPHINSFLFKTKSGGEAPSQSAPKVNSITTKYDGLDCFDF